MERDCESELSKLNIEQNACIYHFGASVIHGQRSNILRLPSNVVTISYPYVTVSDKICKIHPSKVPFINCDLSYIFSPTLYTIVVLNYIVSHSSGLSMNLRTIRMCF